MTELKPEHRIVEENDLWVHGKTYYGSTYFGDWTRYKGGGNPPVFEVSPPTYQSEEERADAVRTGRRKWMEETMNEEQKKAFIKKLVVEKYDLYGDWNEYC